MRVLLIEEGWHSTLRLARGLADADHHVTVLTANGGRATHTHRGVHWRCGPGLDDPLFIAHVDALVAEAAFERIVPLTEAAMRRLWGARVVWSDRLFPQLSPWQQTLALDKHRLVEHAAACGIATPRHVRIDAAFDPERAARELGLPLVLKGSTGYGGRQVRIVETVATVDSRALAGTWIAQEYIASPTYLAGGVFDRGEPLRLYAAEKLAQYPPRTGGAIQLRSLADPALTGLAVRIARELRWTGFASIDAMRRADGSYVLLEMNPRLWGSHAAATAAGVDLFAAFARLLTGVSPAPNLAFAAGVETWIFPKYFRSREHRRVRGMLRAVAALFDDQGVDWRDPRFVVYALRRERRA